jgi:hypothetical protein
MPDPALRIFSCLVILGLIALCAGCSEDIDPRLFRTSCGYTLHINTNEPISNATFYIPLPVKNGTPMMGDILLTLGNFEKDNFSIEFVDSPPNLNVSGLYTRPDNPPLWIKIHADTLSPRLPPDAHPAGFYRAYSIDMVNTTYENSPLAFPDTVYPLENRSVFMPKLHFSSPAVTQIEKKAPYKKYYSPVSIPQQIPVYAEYSASPTTRVEIYSSISLGNYWKEKYDESGGNDYDDNFDWMHTGPSHGWQVAEGEFIAAKGTYPDYSHPVWRKVLNETGNGRVT